MKRALLAAALVLTPFLPAHAAALEKQLDGQLAAIVDDPAHPLASLSVIAVRAGKVVYHRQFGKRHIDANRPANRDTTYRIASISKFVTTLGVMRLIEQGKLELDRDVSDYLGFALRNPAFPDVPITLRMLLTHTSSLRDDGGYYWPASQNVHLREVLVPGGRLHGNGAMWAREHRPGSYFHYANFPWGIVGQIMERATGERFDRLMRREVLGPLGLKGGFHPADFTAADLANVATLYRKGREVDDKMVWDPAGPWVAQVDDYLAAPPTPRAGPDYVVGTNGTLFGPQGNLRLSAEGLSRIMLMLMNDGRHQGRRFLKKSTVDLMLTPHWRIDAGQTNGRVDFGRNKGSFHAWGLGTHVFGDVSGEDLGDRLVEGGGWPAVGHTGSAWGLTSAIAFDRAKKDGFVFLIGGPGVDPATTPGKYSSHPRYEERIMTALHRRAIRRDPK